MRAIPRLSWAVLALVLSGLPVAAQTAAPAPAAGVAATVNGQPILESAVQRGLMRVPPAKQAEIRPQILNFLIDQMLIDQYLLQLQIAVDPKEVDKRIDEMKAELKKRNQDFAKMLEEMKLTEAELREHILADMRWDKFADSRATDKVLQEVFASQKFLFDGSQVRARHILLSPPAGDARAAEQAVADLKAIKQEIEKQVAAGLAKLPASADNLAREKERQKLTDEAFAEQAKKKSVCPSKNQGGDVNWFQGVGFMVEPFSRAAFALQPFQMSDVVQTQFGYHLILLTDRKPGRDVKFEDVKEMVKEHYCTSLHDMVSSQARQKSKIEISAAPK
jgi:peptidyl-prolyl cis-trans isomerase C